MNALINNVYTIFEEYLDEYNRQRAEKIELAYVGECQGFYVFAGDWQNLFLINNEGGFEICLKTDKPETVKDLDACNNEYRSTRYEREFNYKNFIKWLYKRNTLVKNINWTNLQVINHIKKCNTKIKPFAGNICINEKTGKHSGTIVFSFQLGGLFYVETFNDNSRPHCIIKDGEDIYRFYLPDRIPKTQKEMEIVPDFSFKKELYKQKIKDLKHYAIEFLTRKEDGNKHQNYYELLLLYRAFNPDIQVTPFNKQGKDLNKITNPYAISFCRYAVTEYAQKHNKNPFLILTDMFEKGFINEETRINNDLRQEFIKEYPYLFEGGND